MRRICLTIALACFAFVGILAGCARGAGATIAAEAPAAQSPQLVVRGFSMQLLDPKQADLYMKAIDDMNAMGCNWVNFVISARMEDVKSETIQLNMDAVPPIPVMEKILIHAHKLGMHTMLMPIVLLKKAGPKEWRGVIAPPDWDAWFRSYEHYISQCETLAIHGKVDIFCVGSELLSTESFRERWLKVIRNIRKDYHGKLTYSANWDHYTVPTFWDELDYIGMNNYNELEKEPGASVSKLVRAWDPIKKGVLEFGEKMGKPIMFTEVGWHNLQNTISEPWNYVATGPIDMSEQLHAYQAFVQAWKEVPGDKFVGAFVWEWRPGAVPTDHGSYSLQGSPSMDVVRKWMIDGTRGEKGS